MAIFFRIFHSPDANAGGGGMVPYKPPGSPAMQPNNVPVLKPTSTLAPYRAPTERPFSVPVNSPSSSRLSAPTTSPSIIPFIGTSQPDPLFNPGAHILASLFFPFSRQPPQNDNKEYIWTKSLSQNRVELGFNFSNLLTLFSGKTLLINNELITIRNEDHIRLMLENNFHILDNEAFLEKISNPDLKKKLRYVIENECEEFRVRDALLRIDEMIKLGYPFQHDLKYAKNKITHFQRVKFVEDTLTESTGLLKAFGPYIAGLLSTKLPVSLKSVSVAIGVALKCFPLERLRDFVVVQERRNLFDASVAVNKVAQRTVRIIGLDESSTPMEVSLLDAPIPVPIEEIEQKELEIALDMFRDRMLFPFYANVIYNMTLDPLWFESNSTKKESPISKEDKEEKK